MNKIFTIFLCILFLFISNACKNRELVVPDYDKKKDILSYDSTIIGDDANLFSRPDINSYVLGNILKGDRIYIIKILEHKNTSEKNKPRWVFVGLNYFSEKF